MMNKSYVRMVALSILCLVSQPTMSDTTVKLTESNLIRYVQSQSINYQEVVNKNLSSLYNYELLNGNYRLGFNFDHSLEKDKTESLSTFAAPDSDKTKTTLALNKRFQTGTATSLELTNVKYESNSAEYAQNYYTFGLEQNLFPLLFSNAELQTLKAAELDVERVRLQTDIDLLETTKEVLALYWRVQANQKSVQESEDLLKKYDRLVANVRSKRNNSYASAGEVEQALAEYETRKQTMLEDRNTLNTNLQQLKIALNIPVEQKIEIVEPKPTIQMLPAKFNSDVRSLRRFKVQKLKTESAIGNYEASYYENVPQVSVYGKYTGQGLETKQSDSFNELKDEPTDKYVVGVKVNYFFGDDLSKSKQQLRRATQDIEVARFARAEDDLKLQIENTRQKLENAYANLQTTQNVVKYRAEAVKQLNVTYFQGRTDISFLIDAFNKKIQAEVAAINAQGNYATTLIEYKNLIE